jgi:DNA-binding transcriptional regulator YiaG
MALPEIKMIRERLNLGSAAFAALFGVSTRTPQEWEHGRRKRCGSIIIIGGCQTSRCVIGCA